MPSKRKALVAELLAALSPQLTPVVGADNNLPKPIAKLIRQLANQIQRAAEKQSQRAQQSGNSAAKQKLTDELLLVIQAYLGDEISADEPLPAQLEQSAVELATRVTKLRGQRPRKPAAPADPPIESLAGNAPGQHHPAPAPPRRARTRKAQPPQADQ
ncbi:hypothetical protein [Hymenobacter latericus]|uniref:hypothetical protein n=1 Tax=Hymenobacter sp. YIM 151858-1 TaxID=2987688 RepID=UPI002225E84F|nr:hypothetical protein [Hymenobacter sp. YIM 151858-1]UYZ61167.1 hypothetical protein OIS50_19550 [Hymenobacter sp. YIM 151858-1]